MYLNRYFRFYVPGTKRGIIDAEAQRGWASEVTEQFTTWFGGATVTEAKGSFKAHNGLTVTEPVILVESFAEESSYQAFVDDVHALAGEVAKALGQESVALEDCGRLFLIEPEKAEVEAQKVAA